MFKKIIDGVIIITVLAVKPRSLHVSSATEIHPIPLILNNNLTSFCPYNLESCLYRWWHILLGSRQPLYYGSQFSARLDYLVALFPRRALVKWPPGWSGGATSPTGNQKNVLVFRVFSGSLCKKGRQIRDPATSRSSVLCLGNNLQSELCESQSLVSTYRLGELQHRMEGEKGLWRLSFSSWRLAIARIASNGEYW